jgi:hypothetical protein
VLLVVLEPPPSSRLAILITALLAACGAPQSSLLDAETDAMSSADAAPTVDAAHSSDGGADADADAGAGSTDAVPADAPQADGAIAPEDAAVVADSGPGVDAGASGQGLRLANFSTMPLDICVRTIGGVYGDPAFLSSGGVATGSVSAHATYDFLAANFFIKYVPLGRTCTATGTGFNETQQPGNLAPGRTFWFTGRGSPFAGGFLDGIPPTRAQETILFTKMLSINTTLRFVPDDVAMPAVAISATQPTLLMPVPGHLEGNVPGEGTPPPRPFLPQAGGVTRIFVTGSVITVCDELAPPIGALSDCRPTVRAH